ncbi:hypothetical protein SDC9_205998 [bioreactor metagenome]|uniref:Uncharacterized protein n=1 Tax=bioreactor metagenome TaxID=1076179 RepID=A0A645J3K1_9ZZZZ
MHLLHADPHFVGNIDLVGARLRNNHATHHWHPVSLEDILPIGCIQFGISYIAEAYDPEIILYQNEIVEFFGCLHQSHRPDGL